MYNNTYIALDESEMKATECESAPFEFGYVTMWHICGYWNKRDKKKVINKDKNAE